MPYSSPEDRKRLDRGGAPRCTGELTYVLYKTCLAYLKRRGTNYRYQDIAEVLGALSCTAREFYRRIAAPYEDKKIEQNGDVRVDTHFEGG